MAGIFDEDLAPPPQELPPAAAVAAPGQQRVIIQTPAPPTPGMFAEDLESRPPPPPDPNAVDWSRMNAPLGELKPVDRSYTEAAKSGGQDILAGAGMDPYRARQLSEGLVDLGGFTPMGTVLSAADVTYHIPKAISGERKMANLGHAALDTLGALPGARQVQRLYQSARGTLPMTRMADTPTRTVDPQTGAVVDENLEHARAAYDRVANAPIEFMPDSMGNFTAAAQLALQQPRFGAFTPEGAAGVHGLLERWSRDFSGAGRRIPTPRDFDVLRQQLRGFGEGPDSAAGQRAADFVDQFLSNPPPGAVLRAAPGAVGAVRRDLETGRGGWRAGKTAETVEKSIDRAETKAGGANSGLNLGNKTRQVLGDLADPPVGGFDKIFGATHLEKQALRDVSAGDYLTNKQRYISNRMGGGGGFVGSFGGGIAGHTVNNLLGAWGIDPVVATGAGMAAGYTWPKIGEALRRSSNERTVRAAEEAVDLIRRNSPLYRERAARAPDIVDPMAMTRDAVAYALLPQAVQAARDPWDQSFTPYANR